MYLYLGNEGVVVGEWILDVISFQKIFGLCGLKCHIVEIWRDVTFVDVAVFVYLYIFLSYAQNIVFDVRTNSKTNWRSQL